MTKEKGNSCAFNAILKFVQFQLGGANRKEITGSTVSNCLKSIKLFFENGRLHNCPEEDYTGIQWTLNFLVSLLIALFLHLQCILTFYRHDLLIHSVVFYQEHLKNIFYKFLLLVQCEGLPSRFFSAFSSKALELRPLDMFFICSFIIRKCSKKITQFVCQRFIQIFRSDWFILGIFFLFRLLKIMPKLLFLNRITYPS